ncbi:MAG: branched-chain amino acid ABC transporter permease, partial [Tissierellia bacterium]|nr:branched-chain amino acid ABC transporter permease [Tissierellia bacterium]
AMFYISLFHHIYWVLGGIIGSLLGKIIPVDMYGIDFTMTALFVVLFMEQWESSKSKIPIYIGFISSIVFFIVLGKNFLLPSLIFTVGFLLIFKNKIENDMEMILND